MPGAAGTAATAGPVTNATIWPQWCSGTGATTTTMYVNGTPVAATSETIRLVSDTTTVTVTTTETVTTLAWTWTSWNVTWSETGQQRAAREADQAAAAGRTAAAAAAQRREWQEAKEKALELLSFVLTGEQMASYRDHGYFEVRGSRGRRWRIRARGQSGNVDLMPEIGEEREASYCAHPPGHLPDPDAHLAQMLALVTDEDEFVRVANCHYRRPGRRAA